jgi:tetratricopeptide (TPR) repeat protein
MMHIRRDYSQPFYKSQRKRSPLQSMMLLGFLIGGLLLFVHTQFDSLQATALDALGLAATPTPLPADLATQAMTAYIAGDLKQAVALFERVVQQRPGELDYLYEYGLILIEARDYEKAVEIGNQAINANTFDPRGYTIKARAMVWSGNAAGAIPVALAGQEVDRQFSPLHSVLARAYVDIGNVPAGLESAEKAVNADPLNADARRSYAYALNFAGAYDVATEQLETAVGISPNNVQLMLELAAQYLSRDRDQEAISLYSEILALQPNNARAHLRLCDAYRKIGQFEQGLSYCEDAVRSDPTYTTAQFRLGMIKYSAPYRDFAAAREAFQACVDQDPTSLACLYRLGLSHYYLYRDQITLGAIPDTTHCDQAWEILQKSLVMAQNSNDTDAIEDIRQGLGLVSQDCSAYRGLVYPPPVPASTDIPEAEN